MTSYLLDSSTAGRLPAPIPQSGRQVSEGLITGASVAGITVLLLLIAGLAAVSVGLAWGVAAACAVFLAVALRGDRRLWLIVAVVPATLITNSGLVPYDGRYIPATTVLVALGLASLPRLDALRSQARSIPAGIALPLGAYLLWMFVSTLTSTNRVLSAAYLLFSLFSLGIAFLVIPSESSRGPLIRSLVASVAISAVVMLVMGWLLALVGGIILYGRWVGLYFIEEVVVFGHRTGIVGPQDYGPFIGPETVPMALGIAAALYLRSQSRGRARTGWLVVLLVILVGFLSTFSREGWLMAAITCAGLFVASIRAGRRMWAPAIMAVLFTVLFAAAISSRVTVLARLDLTAAWYGREAIPVLMNPNIMERGRIPRDLLMDWPDFVQLKGFSSLGARVSLWRAAIKASQRQPIVGYGAGTDADVIVPYLTGKEARLRGATTHSTYVRILVEMGVPGLLAYAWLTVSALRAAIRHLGRVQLAATVILAGSIPALAISEFTGTYLLGGASFPGFWLALAISLVVAGGPGVIPRTAEPLGLARSPQPSPPATQTGGRI